MVIKHARRRARTHKHAQARTRARAHIRTHAHTFITRMTCSMLVRRQACSKAIKHAPRRARTLTHTNTHARTRTHAHTHKARTHTHTHTLTFITKWAMSRRGRPAHAHGPLARLERTLSISLSPAHWRHEGTRTLSSRRNLAGLPALRAASAGPPAGCLLSEPLGREGSYRAMKRVRQGASLGPACRLHPAGGSWAVRRASRQCRRHTAVGCASGKCAPRACRRLAPAAGPRAGWPLDAHAPTLPKGKSSRRLPTRRPRRGRATRARQTLRPTLQVGSVTVSLSH